MLLHTIFPSTNLVIDDIVEIYEDHIKNFGNGHYESLIPNLKKLLGSFNLELKSDSGLLKLLNTRELIKKAVSVIGENNSNTVLNTNTELNIKKIIKEQDALLYKNLCEILPYTDVVIDTKAENKFLDKSGKLYNKLPENSRALDVYVDYKNVGNMKRLMDNTISSFLDNREIFQNYITHLYGRIIHNRSYHLNFSKLSKGNSKIIPKKSLSIIILNCMKYIVIFLIISREINNRFK